MTRPAFLLAALFTLWFVAGCWHLGRLFGHHYRAYREAVR
jgi:hypothetical protein